MKKSGEELFTNGRSLMDFWRWAHSDILSNSERGRLAEFIVAMALGIDKDFRKEWDAYDLLLKDNTRVEIKSSAYLQSWNRPVFQRLFLTLNQHSCGTRKVINILTAEYAGLIFTYFAFLSVPMLKKQIR